MAGEAMDACRADQGRGIADQQMVDAKGRKGGKGCVRIARRADDESDMRRAMLLTTTQESGACGEI